MEEGNISGSLPLVEEPIPLDFSTFDTNPLSVHKSICDLQARCRTLEKRLEIANFPKENISQAPFSPLEIGEKKKPFTPLVNEKLSKEEQECIIFRMFHRRNEILSTLKPDDIYQLICEKAKSSVEENQFFISAYLQYLHIYLSAIPGLSVLGLNLTKEMEFDGSKLCRNCNEPLLHQHDDKPICNCNRNFTISRACIDLQYYQPINLDQQRL